MIAIKATVALLLLLLLLLLPLLDAADFAQIWSNVGTLTPASAWPKAGQQNVEPWSVEPQSPGSDDPKAWGRAEPQADDPEAWGQETSLLKEEQQKAWDVSRKSFRNLAWGRSS
ncbi:hypothetical protein BsWGS_26360 [Bradybaena similaris]